MIEKLKISAFTHFYFIGIGGIGMSALARYFNHKKRKVSGYDKVETTLTRKLVDEGIEVHYEDDPELIPGDVDCVVYTPAIPSEHKELTWCIENGLPVLKRSEVLGLLSQEKRTIAIAGTHGKTSTSSLIAHNLTYSGSDVSAFVGGIMKNFDSNYVEGKSDWIVVEADEYDRSFLTLEPEVSVLISVDPDHLDIYGNHETMIQGFANFMQKTKPGGHIIIHENAMYAFDPSVMEQLSKEYKVQIYSQSKCAEWFEKIDELKSHFLTGTHNIENAIAAMKVAEVLKVPEEIALEGLSAFTGIKRRFELVYRSDQYLYVDDYAHHPNEIKQVVLAMRKLVGEGEICGIFQPHLYSRTQDFEDEFAEELSKLDQVIILDIYPAREKPIPGVRSDNIFEKLTSKTKIRSTKAELINDLARHPMDNILSIGAGDIDTCVPDIKELLIKLDEDKTRHI